MVWADLYLLKKIKAEKTHSIPSYEDSVILGLKSDTDILG